MKKRTICSLILAGVLGTLSACGNNDTSGEAEELAIGSNLGSAANKASQKEIKKHVEKINEEIQKRSASLKSWEKCLSFNTMEMVCSLTKEVAPSTGCKLSGKDLCNEETACIFKTLQDSSNIGFCYPKAMDKVEATVSSHKADILNKLKQPQKCQNADYIVAKCNVVKGVLAEEQIHVECKKTGQEICQALGNCGWDNENETCTQNT